VAEMAFELIADFGGELAFQVVSEHRHELIAGNHKAIL
jgi:hypothetical protein